MDMTLIHVSYGPTPWPVQAFLVFLIVYPLIFASRRLSEFRQRVSIAASIIPEIFLSLFVGAAIAWLLCIQVTQRLSIAGGGRASTAAGLAEAEFSVVLIGMEIAVLAAFTALLSMRKRTAATATVAWSPVTGLVALAAFITAVLLWWCAHFHAALGGSLTMPTAFMAICAADIILVIVLWRRWSRLTAPKGAIAAAFITVLMIAAIAWWQVQKFQLIALGRA